MTKVCARVVSKLLTSDQKEKRQEICADISKQIEENPKFLDSVITVPAMRYEFSTKRQSMHWKTTNSPRTKKVK